MGIKIKFSPLFIIFTFFLVFFGYFSLYCSYITILLIHEFSHYFMAKSKGYMAQSIHIMPYGLKMSDENVYEKNDEIVIAMIGPIVNIVLALIGVTLWWYSPNLYFYLYDFVFSNFVLGAYNLVPIYPLDGGRVVLALFDKKHKKTVLLVMKIVAIVFALLFFVLFLISFRSSKNISFLMMCLFLLSTVFDRNKKQVNSVVDFKNRSNIEVKTVLVNKRASLSDMIKIMKGNFYYNFIVVDDDYKVIKKVSQNDLIEYMTNR